ncbi:MAG: lactate racemase domain-containing protein [Terriglobia bacterium]
MIMAVDGNVHLSAFHLIERTAPTVQALENLDEEIRQSLSGLNLPAQNLRGKQIAVAVGSRGIANLQQMVRAVCGWLKAQGANPFIFPAMGSHGGATAEGQLKILAEYGVTSDLIGAEVRSSMATVSLGKSPEGFQVFMDRQAWESDGVVVINRVKPHTDFSGKTESGLLKMMAVGMGKEEGARETHYWGWKHGFAQVIRAMSAIVLASRKILCGLAVAENEMHQTCALRAARPDHIVSMEEELLMFARPLLPRLPFSRLHLLIVDELGKNISGTGMDTNVIGRGFEMYPVEGPHIGMIYVRDLTPESGGNAVGMGLADVIHDRFYQKIDFQKTYLNSRVSLNPAPSKLPMHLPSDRDAIGLALGHLGRPDPAEQRVVWIRNTLSLNRLAVSAPLAEEASRLAGWCMESDARTPQFDSAGNLTSPL